MRKVTYRPELVEQNIELSVRHLKQFFKFGHGASSFKTKAVHDVSFDIYKGECFGLVGESGCGKTTTGRSLIRLYDITSGSIYFKGYRISAGSRWNEKEIKWSRIKGQQKIRELRKMEENELRYISLPGEVAEELHSLDNKIESSVLEIEKIELEYKDLIKTAKSELKLEEKTNEVNRLKAELHEKVSELEKVIEECKKQKVVILHKNGKSDVEISKLTETKKSVVKEWLKSIKILEKKENKEKYYYETVNSLGMFKNVRDKDYRNKEEELYYAKLSNSLKVCRTKNPSQPAVKVKVVKRVKGPSLEEKQAAIKEKYEAEIAKIKQEFASIKKREKANIAQIKFDNRHVNKKLMSKMQMIFQDPVDSLDPRMTVEDIIQEGLRIQGQRNRFSNSRKVANALERVGLIPEYASRYPHEFSGGQRQRIGIARALIMNPDFLICDEPISALDVSIRAQIINLLNDLKEEMGLTILFIAHDLSVVKYFCDRIAVMYYGEIVELASSDELFAHPLHPYTDALLSAIPKPDPNFEKVRQRHIYNPDAEHDYSKEKPTLQEILPGHFVLANSEEMEKYRQKIKQLDAKKR